MLSFILGKIVARPKLVLYGVLAVFIVVGVLYVNHLRSTASAINQLKTAHAQEIALIDEMHRREVAKLVAVNRANAVVIEQLQSDKTKADRITREMNAKAKTRERYITSLLGAIEAAPPEKDGKVGVILIETINKLNKEVTK